MWWPLAALVAALSAAAAASRVAERRGAGAPGPPAPPADASATGPGLSLSAPSRVGYAPGWGGAFHDPSLPRGHDPTAGWHERASAMRAPGRWPPHPLDAGLATFPRGQRG